MTYIILVAGKGSRLHPLTLKMPKTLYKLDKSTTVLQRMVSLIRKHDHDAKIVAVTGFLHEEIEKEVSGATFVHNPFYEVTNSIASLWFARSYLKDENVTIINGDIVMEEDLIRDELCRVVDRPLILLDSSIKIAGDYNAQVNNGKVLVMSKQLESYFGEYAGVTKLDRRSAAELDDEICKMVEGGLYCQWYEDALVQMIFNEDFELGYVDIRSYTWTEVDCVSDMLLAKKIHLG
jgi:choline kinase